MPETSFRAPGILLDTFPGFVPGTLELVPWNRSLHCMKQRFPICWAQEPVDWFRGTDRFATRIVNFSNFVSQEPVDWFRGTDRFITTALNFNNILAVTPCAFYNTK